MNKILYEYKHTFSSSNGESESALCLCNGTYEYDALYRLIKATGRELNNLTAPTHNDFANTIPCPNTAANAMRNYTHNYRYDALGNILQDAWKSYKYATANNRLLGNNGLTNQYTYDAHSNILKMPHLSSMVWNGKDQLTAASPDGTSRYIYGYDAQGNRTGKVAIKGNVTEIRCYISGYEIYRKYTNNILDYERKTLNIYDDEKVFVRIEQKTGESEVVRYQYDNHLGSACLELDNTGAIISYEEYHPFGTTSYRSGKSETEVSLKRYKYCGKERDEGTGLYYYGMRYYAAWLCRFVSVDPLQFKYPYYTPYQYAGNKPITFIDLDGMEPAVRNEKHEHTTGFGPNKVGTMENPVKLGEVTVTPSTGDASIAELYNSESFRYGYSMSFEQYKADYGYTGTYAEVEKQYRAEYGYDYENIQIPEWDRQESNRIAVEKMMWFMMVFQSVSTVNSFSGLKGAKSPRISSYFSNKVTSNAQAEKITNIGGEKIDAAKGGVQYTKSSLKIGQQMHNVYKAGDVVPGVAIKEFRGIKCIRPDFVDLSTKTIYELKPFNPRGIQMGTQQLNRNKSIFEIKYPGTTWNTVLDLY